MTLKNPFPLQIYTSSDGTIQVDVRIENESIWLTQKQMSSLFDTERSVITKHIKNIFKSEELIKDSVSAKFAHTAKDGKNYQVIHYDLDMIISVGYRVNSKQATQFRIRATNILKHHITKGYTINRQRLSQTGVDDLIRSIDLIKRTLDIKSLSNDESQGLLRLMTQYIPSLITLHQYDSNSLQSVGKTTEAKYIATVQQANTVLAKLKTQLIKDHEATQLFAQTKDTNGLQSILGAIYQSYDGRDVYPTIEEKAANLLYLTIKNHPFVDGNKRSGAFLFVRFLSNNGILYDDLGLLKVNQQTLVALALLVATSNPREKSLMIRLIIQLLS